MNRLLRILSLSALPVILLAVFLWAENQESANPPSAKEAAKVFQEKKAETTQQLQDTTKEIDKKKSETQVLLEQKKALEIEAQAATKEALAAKEEARLTMSSAARTGDAEAKQRAQELHLSAIELEKKAKVNQEKAQALELKAQANEQRITANVAAIEAMKKQLSDLNKEKSLSKHWTDRFIEAGVIVVLCLFLLWLLSFLIKKFEAFISEKDAIRESEKILRIKTLSSLLKWVASLGVLTMALYMIFENFGIDMAPLLAGAGIAGLAFGFGGQYLIRDIINGIFIMLEGQFRINDVIKIGDTGGLVESVNLRVTKLRDLEGRVIYIPNGEIKTVINFTQEYARAVLNIGVAYKENVDQVMSVIKSEAAEMRKDAYYSKLILEDLEMLGVDDFGESQVTIKCRFKTLPIKQWEVAREFRRRIKNKFDELGIEIPFPHRMIYFGNEKSPDLSQMIKT